MATTRVDIHDYDTPDVAPSDSEVLHNAKLIRDAIGLASETEIAAILQVSHETLATWRTKRRGPPSFKLGKRVFYLLSAFSEWVMREMERQQPNAPHHIPRTTVAYKPSDPPVAWMR